ncbi:MAG TPA: substrate-binding domain-containing protein [Roseiflexaceae bacterium]|nr:substrate-binding domain-containing protein [Roseiflexaceae bacterium]
MIRKAPVTDDWTGLGSASTPQLTPDRRAVVGFLSSNIHVGVSRTLWLGVVDAAARHDVSLVCFPGGGLRAAGAERQRNLLYDLADPQLLDGLVAWSSTITGASAPDEAAAFYQRYRPLPMVSMVQPVEATPNLSVDSYQGMREAICHLVEVHGYRRLGFIRGPAGHYHADERYRAYLDVLREYGIPADPRLITRPFHWEDGADAVGALLDEAGLLPGVDLEAIVAVSDLMALAALKGLQARGMVVPRDVALVGFNDSVEGRLASPPLTSVVMPLSEQGAQALALLVAQLEGEQPPAQVMLTSRLVVRQSCGCPSSAVAQAAAEAPPPLPEPLERALGPIRAAFLAAATPLCGESPGCACELERVVETFHAELCGGRAGFLEELERALERAMAGDSSTAVWQNVVSALRRCVLPYLDAPARQRAENLLGQARVLIGEVAQRALAFQQLQAERQAATLRAIGQALITTFDVATLVDVLAEQLPQLGIASCALALYERPSAPLDQVRLVLAYGDGGRMPLEPGGSHIPAADLLHLALAQGRRRGLVVEPLFFHDDPLGLIVFEIGPRDATIYELLRGYISSALKGALLVQEAQRARVSAEKADWIKTRLLANVSHELRTPLHIILEQTRAVLDRPHDHPSAPPAALRGAVQHIQQSAEHQIRLINDLLDLSRAEIDELDLHSELIDVRPLLAEAFASLAGRAPAGVEWRQELPERLPWIYGDSVRLRQILLNLLSNAQKFTVSGHITLGAEVVPPHLHIWVEDTGAGIPVDQQEHVFEPFVTVERRGTQQRGGIGLGLSITRRLVALHGGTLTLESQPGAGSVFRITLPLPSLSQPVAGAPGTSRPTLLVVSSADPLSGQIVTLAERMGLELARLRSADDLERALAQAQPVALAWDLDSAGPGDWVIVRRLRSNPRWSELPFMLYGQAAGEGRLGITSFVPKPAGSQTLADAISAASPLGGSGPILIVDDDPQAREQHRAVVAQGLPGYPILLAENGRAALEQMAGETPSLVILDLVMPEMDGADLLDHMRADPRLRQTPVVVLSNKLLGLEDVRRLEQHAHVTLQTKDILSPDETLAAFSRALLDTDTLPPYTSALVKRAVAYLHQHYSRQISRWELAQEVGVSEDYLSRVFNREIGLSPWEYLNRYRIAQARALLRRTNDSIGAVAQQVGFQDRGYFSRVFRKLTGVGPQEFRERQDG